jgi:ubiquinone/menaquinone biosynthesis C-methylase UbiE
MYFDDEAGLQAALAEVFRVLEPGGLFRIWDVDTEERGHTFCSSFRKQEA